MIFKSESSSELLLALSYCNNRKRLTHITSYLSEEVFSGIWQTFLRSCFTW